MSDMLRKAISLGLGLTAYSREKAQQFVDEMVLKGELGKNESKDVINQLIEKGEQQQFEIKRMVQEQVKKVLDELDVATKQDLRDLEQKLSATGQQQPPSY
jgi:polyhydroxyalkanoate synthesis regulator phasin